MIKRVVPIILLILGFLTSLSLLLYPFISNYINSQNQTIAISSYNEKLASLSEKDYSDIIDAARAYNEQLALNPLRFRLKEEDIQKYKDIMDIAGNGVIGTLTIDALNLRLPLYLGTNEAVLQVGIGHLEGSSLPIGGLGTHSAISGHRGLPSSILLTEVDRLVVEDVFLLNVLGIEMYYEIDNIIIVEPQDMQLLDIDAEMDYCTIVTCTPYGINTHRLLLRGHRIYPEIIAEASEIKITIRAEAERIPDIAAYAIMAVPVIFVVIIYVIIKNAIITIRRRG